MFMSWTARLFTTFVGAAALVACQSGRPRLAQPAEVPRVRSDAVAPAAPLAAAPGLGAAAPVPQPSDGKLTLYFLDVGQGDGTLIVCPNGTRHLIDLGTSSSQDVADPQTIRQTLRSLLDPTTPTLATLVVTHPDSDHYNLLAGALGNPNPVTIGSAFVSGAPSEFEGGFRSFYQALLDAGTASRFSTSDFDPMHQPSDRFDCGDDVYIWVLAAEVPEPSTKSNFIKNTRSAVLLISYGDFDAILTGDATFTTENAILANYPNEWLDSDLLKLGHHGSRATSSSSSWLKAVAAEVAIASSGFEPQGNQYGHPSKTVIDRATTYTNVDTTTHKLYSCDDPLNCSTGTTKEWIYSTPSAGTIIVATDGSSFTLTCMRPGGC